MLEYHSSLALVSYLKGMDLGETISLFNEDVYRHLEFPSAWDSSTTWLLHESNHQSRIDVKDRADTFRADTFRMDALLDGWIRRGCFMHGINHPKVSVFADLARDILTALNLPAANPHADEFVYDDLADGPVWPVYPEIAASRGIPGDYRFKLHKKLDNPVSFLTLEEFVEASFEVYRGVDPDDIVCERLDSAPYREFGEFLNARARSPHRSGTRDAAADPAASGQSNISTPIHPYRNLPDFHFWRRSIENVGVEDVDPVVPGGFRIGRDDRIATAGSCFAQHISRMMRANELNYYVAETAPGHLSDDEAVRRNYGVFSARYGNIYTARQLLQLFDRCYGNFRPLERVWRRADGKYVDPFRPEIEPDGFETLDLLDAARSEHLSCVRQMFERLDVLVLTLGLTECWRATNDGAIFPLPPGAAASDVRDGECEFVNFTAAEVTRDLGQFLDKLAEVNKRARVILTVSPVPIIATFENRHALVANTYTKSALRVAADEVTRARHQQCFYFPSYELIVGNFHRGSYVEKDLRGVTQDGLDHLMRLFLRHYFDRAPKASHTEAALREADRLSKIVCEEERLAV